MLHQKCDGLFRAIRAAQVNRSSTMQTENQVIDIKSKEFYQLDSETRAAILMAVAMQDAPDSMGEVWNKVVRRSIASDEVHAESEACLDK